MSILSAVICCLASAFLGITFGFLLGVSRDDPRHEEDWGDLD